MMSLVFHGRSRERSQRAYRHLSRYKSGNYGINQRSDEWVYYASEIRPYYDGLNGLIGQLAGLLILGQAKGCFEYYISLAQEPLVKAEEHLSGLYSIYVPIGSKKHFQHVIMAANIVISSCKKLKENVVSPVTLNHLLIEMVSDLKQASTLLRCASDQTLKMQTIDISLSCACCKDSSSGT